MIYNIVHGYLYRKVFEPAFAICTYNRVIQNNTFLTSRMRKSFLDPFLWMKNAHIGYSAAYSIF